MKNKRRWRYLGSFALLATVTVGVITADYLRFLHGPMRVNADSPRTFVIEPGTSVQGIANELAREGLFDRPLYFRLIARATGAATRIQAGEYAIQPGSTPYRLLQKIVAGEVKQYRITLIEGWTVAEMLDAIWAHDAIEPTLEGESPDSIMERLGHPDLHYEGRFFPDSYQFPRGTRDIDLLQRSFARMQHVLEEEWQAREEGLPIDTPAEALTLASIIERETGVPEERARIAGVFVERLERGMRLQTDPTVIYGLGEEYQGDIRYRHLREDTPYNTYTRAGLPPTPIALSSREAIHAALHPDRRGDLYFVSTGDGRHVFSETLEQHNQAVIEYQLDGNADRLRGR
ncbi:MAG: endolytic transglycosylase MltG [Halofilum sp. (in: g-proteobacteria)]